HSMRIKENQSGWGSFGYDLVAGLTDPGNWLVGAGVGGLANGVRVGATGLEGALASRVGLAGRQLIPALGSSGEAFASGQVAKGIGYSVAENVAGSVLTDVALVGMGENRTVADFMTDAAFSAGIGTAMNLRGIRSAAAV